MKRFGIHFRLLLAAFTLISATTFTLGYIGVNIIHEFVQTRFEERIRFLAAYLALNAELGILIDERPMLKRLAENLVSEKDVVKVTIFSRADEILAEESKAEYDNPTSKIVNPTSEIVNRKSKIVNPTSEYPVIEMPVILKESREENYAFRWHTDMPAQEKIIGKVRITYSTAEINRLLSIMKMRFLLLAVILAVVCVVIFYVISRSVVAPLTGLVRAARRVEKGDLELRVTLSNLPETRELALAFNAMLDSLEKSRLALDEANREMIRQKTLAERGKFSMMVAHEVKNPLGIIKSSIDMLKKDITDPSGQMMIVYIEDEIKRLNRLIEDFLQFARPTLPMFRLVDVNVVLSECVSRFEMMSKNGRDIEMKISIPKTPCQVSADPDMLIRAFDNVLKNAFESNGHNGIVEVNAKCENNAWIVEISDRGAGIDPENLDMIFEPFFTTRSKGTGLGLAFVSQTLTAHGGTISAQNREDGGARFIIKIPIS